MTASDERQGRQTRVCGTKLHGTELHGTELHGTKLHGAGNDFLVLVDLEDRHALDAVLVRALCDRSFGVGADGVIRVLAGRDGTDLSMDLVNADGGVAEMSGNGMRCLAEVAVEERLVDPPTFTVWTLAGTKTVEYRPGDRVGSAEVTVEMGKAELGPDERPPVDGARSRRVDTGNPHVVVVGPDPFGPEGGELGRRLYELHGRSRNVELIDVDPGGAAMALRVWERGVGETEACGTGSVAAAAAAHAWGLVGRTVEVRNPGGTLGVDLGDDDIRLSGPVRRVAEIDVDTEDVLGAARP